MGARATWNWRITPRTTAIISSTWYETTPSLLDRTDILTDNSVSVERRLRRTVTGIVRYGTLSRNSQDASAEYQRNLLSLALRATF